MNFIIQVLFFLKKVILLVTSFLLLKVVKLLYFTYSIVNFTALNLQGITSLHLLTSRVECTSFGLTILSLQVALTTLRWCVTRFSALQVLYRNTTLLGLSCCQRRLLWLLRFGRFIAYTLLHFLGSRSNYLSRIGSSII